MISAILVLAASSIAAPETNICEFLSALMASGNFGKAPSIARTLLPRGHFAADEDGEWIRFRTEDDRCSVELGPMRRGQPRKVTSRCSFESRVAAARFLEDLGRSLPVEPEPRLPLVIEDELSWSGTVLVHRRPVGIELDLLMEGSRWVTAMVLIPGGPRMLVPLKSTTSRQPFPPRTSAAARDWP